MRGTTAATERQIPELCVWGVRLTFRQNWTGGTLWRFRDPVLTIIRTQR